MLAKSERLTKRQFDTVMEKGRVSHSPLFLLRTAAGQADTRISVAVPQKVAKKAVTRNRIRRRVYEAIRPSLPTLVPNVWTIMFAKKDISELAFEELKKATESALRSASLLQKS